MHSRAVKPMGTYCKKHPQYKAIMMPRAECATCKILWKLYGKTLQPAKKKEE